MAAKLESIEQLAQASIADPEPEPLRRPLPPPKAFPIEAPKD